MEASSHLRQQDALDSLIMGLTCMVDHKGREMQDIVLLFHHRSYSHHIKENNNMITITNNIFVFTICLFTLTLTSCLFQDVFTAVIQSFLLPPYLIILYILIQQVTHILLVIRYLFPSPVATAKDDLKTFCTGTTQSNLVSPVVPSSIADFPTPEFPPAVEELPSVVKKRFGNFYDYGKERQRTSNKYLPLKNKYDVPLEPYASLRPTGIDGMLEDLRRAQREQKALSLPMPPTPPTSPALLPSPSPEAPATPLPRTISSEDKLVKSSPEEQCRDSSPGAFSESIFCSEGFAQCPGFDTSSTPSTHSEQINSEEISHIQCVADQEPLSLIPPFTFVADPIAHGLRVYSSGPLGERAAVDDATLTFTCNTMQSLSLGDDLDDDNALILEEFIPEDSASPVMLSLLTTSNDQDEPGTPASPAVTESSLQYTTSIPSEDHSLSADLVAVQDEQPSTESTTRPQTETQHAAVILPEGNQVGINSNADLGVPTDVPPNADLSLSAAPIHPITENAMLESSQPSETMDEAQEQEIPLEIPVGIGPTLSNLDQDTEMVDAEVVVDSSLQDSTMDIVNDIPIIVACQEVEMSPATTESQQLNFPLFPTETPTVNLPHHSQVFQTDFHPVSSDSFPTESMDVDDQHDVQDCLMTSGPETSPAVQVSPLNLAEPQDSEMPDADPDVPMTSDLPITLPIMSAPAFNSQAFRDFNVHFLPPQSASTSPKASIPATVQQFTIGSTTTCQRTLELESPDSSLTTSSKAVPTSPEEDTLATSSHEVSNCSIIQEGPVADLKDGQSSAPAIETLAVQAVCQVVADEAHLSSSVEQTVINQDKVSTSTDYVAPVTESSKGHEVAFDQSTTVLALTTDGSVDNTEQSSASMDASCSSLPGPTTIIPSPVPEEGGQVIGQPTGPSPSENQQAISTIPATPVEPIASGSNTTTPCPTVTPSKTSASKPAANFLRSSATPVKRNGFFFKAPAGQPRAKDSLAAKARMATAQIALGRSGKKDFKSMLAAASDEIGSSSKSRNNDGAGPSSSVSTKTSGSSARSSAWMKESSYLDDEDDSASEDDTSMFGMGTSTSSTVTINKVEVSKSALERFKSKVISRRIGYKYASEEFVNEVVQKAMQECGVEGLIWQMATNDPLACDSTTRRDQRWYLRWAISKFNLAPEVNKPAERPPEIGEEAGRRVVGLRKGRLASAALEETPNVKRHASAHNSGDA